MIYMEFKERGVKRLEFGSVFLFLFKGSLEI